MKKHLLKILILTLVTLLVVSISACDTGLAPGIKPTSSPDNNSDVVNTAKTPAEAIDAATKKIKSAQSYAITVNMFEQYENESEEYCYYGLVTKKNNEETLIIAGDENFTEQNDIVYSKGNIGYEHEVYNSPWGGSSSENHVYISDESVFMNMLHKGIELIENKNFLIDFSQKQLENEEKDGNITYSIKLNVVDFFKLITLEDDIDEEYAEFAKVESMCSVSINKDGYLSAIEVRLSAYADENTVVYDVSGILEFSRFNEEINIEEPNFVSAAKDNIDQIYFIENGYYFDYGHGSSFEGISANYNAKVVVPVYKVKTEIYGKTVTNVSSVGGLFNSEEQYIEKLIIPKGITFGGMRFGDEQVYSNSEVFFEDQRPTDDTEREYCVIGEENPESFIVVKAVYYAGEWEMTNGVPSPVNNG